MITKEIVKKEIDDLPEEMIKELYDFIHQIKRKTEVQKKLKTYRLKGQFDSINIRKLAYE